MNLSKKIAYNTVIQIISKVVSTILGLIAVAIMTRYLGQSGFGDYITIITFLSFFAVIADLGLTLVTTQLISQPNADQDKILGNLLSLRLATAVIFLGLSPVVVLFFPYSAQIKIGVAIVSLSFLFTALSQIFVGLFQKQLRMDKVSWAEVISRAVLVLGVVLAQKNDWGLLGLAYATTFSSAVSFLLHYIFSCKYARVKLLFDKALWLKIFKYSWPLAVTIFFNLIYLRADTLILSLIKTSNEVGIYGAAYRVIDVLVTIPYMFAGIILPLLTISWASGDKERFNTIMQRSIDVMCIMAMPMIFGTQFVAEKIMVMVAGKDFSVSGPVLQVLIIAVGLMFAGCMFSHAIIAIERQKNIIWAYVFTSLTALIGYVIFIPKYSYFGAAWVTIYSEFAIAFFAFILLGKYSRFWPNAKVFSKSLISAVAMFIALYLCRKAKPDILLWQILAIGGAVYLPVLYLFKGISKNDIMILIKRSE